MSGFLFIRHAETDMAGTFCGHLNPAVNARGHQQIQTLLKALEAEPITSVYTSDLQRASTTAEAIAGQFEIPIVTRPHLREISFGEWDGLCWEQIEQRDPVYAGRWLRAYPNMPSPNGESYEAFQTRVMGEAEHLLRLSNQGFTAVVTHAGVMRVVLRSLCGINDEQELWNRTSSYCSFFRYAQEAVL